MSRLAGAIEGARAKGRAAFIPYVTAGDPSLEATALFAKTLAAAGADILELGVPFTDPFADGPVNQSAAQRALLGGTTLNGILDAVTHMRASGLDIPIVLFTYFNPVLNMGRRDFCRLSRKAGVDGALIVDLPPEEADSYIEEARRSGLETVFLASPTTSPERLRLIDASSTGFVYYVSRLGVTGARENLSATLAEELNTVKGTVKAPVAVGFGISTPDQAREAAAHADAVVVGSALVKFARHDDVNKAAEMMNELASRMIAGLGLTPRPEV
ncbi:MAG: tryptophan synthase subunit alpha [Deltaproteobacteria bacterium]|nr:tryptophan synthase subunit alpha [Deltaproteobacteria bacterium]